MKSYGASRKRCAQHISFNQTHNKACFLFLRSHKRQHQHHHRCTLVCLGINPNVSLFDYFCTIKKCAIAICSSSQNKSREPSPPLFMWYQFFQLLGDQHSSQTTLTPSQIGCLLWMGFKGNVMWKSVVRLWPIRTKFMDSWSNLVLCADG